MAKKTTNSKQLERRSTIRAKRVLSIRYRIIKTRRKNVDKDWYLSTTEDMSAEGLSFYAETDLKPGEIIDLHVVMSGILDIYRGEAKVVRTEQKKPGAPIFVGVKLLPPKKSSRRAKKV